MIGGAPCEKTSTAVIAPLLSANCDSAGDAYDWQRSLWRDSDL